VTDPRWMRRCLVLARRAEGRTAPNPIVGCVIVDRRGQVLAEGWHRRAGGPHAEIDALARLGGRAPGATLYVNLEPCNHRGKTGPCAPVVAASGVRRVVIGALDPIPGHGGGAEVLARAGIAVDTGVLADACEEANRPFFTVARHRRPWIVLKAGVTLDGRVATHTGESRWITGEAARADVHRLRARLDAIVVGVGTVLADDPRLTVRGVRGGRDPVRVVVDSSLRTPTGARVVAGGGRVIIATTARAAATRRRRLELAGAELWELPDHGGLVDLKALCRRLARERVMSVLVEGGPTVHASFLAAGLADEVRLYVAPLVLGGHGRHGGPAWVGGAAAAHLQDGHRLRFGAPRRLGDDLLLIARAAR
jgi:diaminohydroxyphosphoribosylaminopyrimidine deaminase / 5-amino-6-(5-phosphoribosylamino)uracil reductase